MPRASTPRSARVTDGYDSDSDDDDVNEVGTFPFAESFGAEGRLLSCSTSIILSVSNRCT
jgi:hypothetical protein